MATKADTAAETPIDTAIRAGSDAVESIAATGAEAVEAIQGTGIETLDTIADFFAPPHMIARRRRRRELAMMTDAQLAELGLTRDQVKNELDHPSWDLLHDWVKT